MSEMLLDTTGILTSGFYIGFFIAAWVAEHRKQLAKACQHYWTAVALAVLKLVIDVISVPHDGWTSVAISTFNLTAAVTCAKLAERRRDRVGRAL